MGFIFVRGFVMRPYCPILAALALLIATDVPVAQNSSMPLAVPEQLKNTIAAAIANRRINETRALVLDPNLDERDVGLLTDEELDSSPINRDTYWDKPFPRDPSAEFSARHSAISARGSRYGYWIAQERPPYRSEPGDLRVDVSLPRLELSIRTDESDPLHPIAALSEAVAPPGLRAFYFFEFDTTPDFDSPNSWRYPSLTPTSAVRPVAAQNLTSRDGLVFDVFYTTQRGVTARERTIRFPFRATAMRLPNDWHALTFDELERQALALGYGLSPKEVVEQVYRYGRHTYVWGADSLTRSALDTFRAGVAACTAVNGLIGAMLEMNGLRHRIVSGFDPKARTALASAGHSAIEVLDPQAGWSFVDSYLDLLLSGVSAEMLAEGNEEAGKMRTIGIDATHFARRSFGEGIKLERQFKYRRYGDQLTRMPMMSALQLRASGGETQYGAEWTLNVAPPRALAELFPERLKIFVRARYVFAAVDRITTPGDPIHDVHPSAPVPVASPWSTTSFEIAPRQLLAHLPPPRITPKPNLCQQDDAKAVSLRGPFAGNGGHAFTVPADEFALGDAVDAPRRSRLLLCEDGVPLGPAHAVHDDIRIQGKGRFSHWHDQLYLSASDNSDPNTNGRSYTIVQQAPRSSTPVGRRENAHSNVPRQ